MKNLSLAVIALVLAVPVFADDAKAVSEPILLALADTGLSVNVKSGVATGSVDRSFKDSIKLVNAKTDAELSAALAKEAIKGFKL
jgi:hypothetical protein